jgi:hypothetical protein
MEMMAAVKYIVFSYKMMHLKSIWKMMLSRYLLNALVSLWIFLLLQSGDKVNDDLD